MFKFFKTAAALAILPVLAISTSAFAGSPGQLAGGDNYMVKNLTKGGAYANTVSASCNDEVQYSMQLSNTQFGALDNVTLSATLPSGGGQSTATATTSLGGVSGTSDTTTVNLSSTGSSQSLENGTTTLYDDSGHVIKTLPDTVASGGVNIGTIAGSTTKFVNFKAKVGCPTPPVCPAGTTGTPPNCVTPPTPKVVCDALAAEVIGSTNVPAQIKFTAKGTASGGATINGYSFNFGDGANANSQAASVNHTYAKAGDYQATVQVKSSLGVTAVSQSCAVMIKVTEEKPPVVTPPVTPPSTPGVPTAPGSTPTTPSALPSTGPEAAFSGILGTSALGFGVRQFIGSRRRLSDLLS